MTGAGNGVHNQDPVFTRYVQTVATGAEPDDALVEAVWQTLRRLLRGELRRRGLGERPPSYLGVLGQTSWRAGSGSKQGDTLDELVGDCFAFALIERMASLVAQLRKKETIDGVVVRNVRHFVHERQEQHDPIGKRVFTVLRTTLRKAVASGRLHVVAGSKSIHVGTVLAFGPATEEAAPAATLAPHVATWNDELMPELVTTTGRGLAKLEHQLLACITRLTDAGITAFRFRDVLDPLRLDLRGRWSATFQAAFDVGHDGEAEDSVVSLVRAVEALGADLEHRDTFEALNRCVEERLRASEADVATRKLLWAVWRALIAWARTRPSEPDDDLKSQLSPDVVPSRREMGRRLKIPRDRLPTLYRMIGEFVTGCRERIHLPVAKPGTPDDSPPSSNATMNFKQRQQALIERSRAAAKRAVAPSSPAEEASGESTRLGAVHVLDHQGASGLEWVVLRAEGDPKTHVLMIAADTDPNAGLHDVVVPSSALGGPLTLRTGFLVSLPEQALKDSKSRAIDRSYVDHALDALRRRRVDGVSSHDDVTLDDDPDFADWTNEIRHAANDLNARHLEPSAPLPFERPTPARPRRAARRWMPVAATFAIATVGMAVWNGNLRRDVARFDNPFVIADGPDISMFETTRGGKPTPIKPEVDLVDAYLSLRGYRGDCKTFRVELIDANATPIWSQPITVNADGDIPFGLERRVFERGPKRVRLYDLCENTGKPVAEQDFDLVLQAPEDDG